MLTFRMGGTMAEQIGACGDTLITREEHHLIPSAMAGKSNCVLTRTGEVLSVHPDGSQHYQPAGTDAAYERCTLQGDQLVYAYRAADGNRYVHVVAWKSAEGVAWSCRPSRIARQKS